jgi:hypothetical protein
LTARNASSFRLSFAIIACLISALIMFSNSMA